MRTVHAAELLRIAFRAIEPRGQTGLVPESESARQRIQGGDDDVEGPLDEEAEQSTVKGGASHDVHTMRARGTGHKGILSRPALAPDAGG